MLVLLPVRLMHALLLIFSAFNSCICMEKGRTYFQQDVAFMTDVGFDTVKIDQCGRCARLVLAHLLLKGLDYYSVGP